MQEETVQPQQFIDPADNSAKPLEEQLADAQLAYVTSSTAMATSLAENYTGLPYDHGWSYR